MRKIYTAQERLSGDFTTPIEIFNTFYRNDEYNNQIFLESVVGNEYVGRYSFITLNMLEELIGYKKHIIILRDGNRVKKPEPIAELKSRINDTVVEPSIDKLIFSGGYIGYFSFESLTFAEEVVLKESVYPLFHFVLPEFIIAFDNVFQIMTIIALSFDKSDVREKLQRVKAILQYKRVLLPILSAKSGDSDFELEYTKPEFLNLVRRTKEYIYAGDTFQTVISQSLYTHRRSDIISIYRRLRGVNPSPYMFLLSLDEVRLIGSSPEILVKKMGNKAILRPIAGTNTRGMTKAEDILFEKQLLNDKKELAEHTMLIDLARNDLGRVCDIGSVKLTASKKIERYSHVMHIVSEIEGDLSEKYDPVDLFFSAFPAGTVSGAPKLRAVEIIDELEKSARGPYAGAVGYFDFSGNMDFCITIRTLIESGDNITLRAGAGIVYDSIAEKEYQETLNKARALMQIL